jgi:hypothetical protein
VRSRFDVRKEALAVSASAMAPYSGPAEFDRMTWDTVPTYLLLGINAWVQPILGSVVSHSRRAKNRRGL